MKTDIIIPTYLKNEWLIQRTIECFESIIENTDNFRIIWVDNGSNIQARKTVLNAITPLKKNKLQLIFKDKPLGFVRPINLGLDLVTSNRAKYIVFLNNDTITTPHWLDNMIKYDCDITGPWPCPQDWEEKMKQEGHNIEEWTYHEDKKTLFNYAKKAQVLSRLLPVDFIPFYCVLFKRKVVEDLGHLNEDFGKGLFDDDDYLWKAREKKYKIGIATDSYVHHFAKQTFLSIGEKYYRRLFLKNWKKFKQLHPTWNQVTRYINCENMIKTWLKEN